MHTTHRPRFSAPHLLAACCALLIAACGGSPAHQAGPLTATIPLTATVDNQGNSLVASDPVVLRFSVAANPATLQLTGALGAVATASWNNDNTMLTLAPPSGGWARGENLALSVQVSGTSGQPLQPAISRSWFVPLSFSNGQAPDVAVGKPTADTYSLAYNSSYPTSATTISGLVGPAAFSSSGLMAVPDGASNRILFWNSVPTTSGAAAAFAIGQPDLTSSTSALTRSGLAYPMDVAFGGGKMAVPTGQRVLIWNTEPTGFGSLPDVVIGQSDFTSELFGCGPLSLLSPEAAKFTPDGKFIVADAGNHRVLVWNSVPANSVTPPDLVLGQPDLDSCTPNNDPAQAPGTASLKTLSYPSDIWTDGQRLVVVDSSNYRVLVWNTFPTSSQAPADLIVGQSTPTNITPYDDNQDGSTDAASARTFRPYKGVASNGVQLAISDGNGFSTGKRVLIWNTFPTSNFQPADRVLGQANFTSTGSPGTGANFTPGGLLLRGSQLFVTDMARGSVLIFNSR